MNPFFFIKSGLALVLSLSLMPTAVFAAEPTETAALPTLTYEQALEKARAHSSDLKDLQDYADFLQKTKEDLWDSVGYFNTATYEYQKWVNDVWYTITSAAYQTDSGMKQNAYTKELTELALQATVKSYFTTIFTNLDSLKLAQKNAEVQKALYQQGQVKNRMGLLSKYQLDQLEIASQKAQDNVALLENALEQEYMKLNGMMGEKPEVRFRYIYDVTYAPYELKRTLDQYIVEKTKNDPSIKLRELAFDNAKFNRNYLPESWDGSQDNRNEMTYDQAKRAVKTAKENKEFAIRNAYLQIQQLETVYASAQADLKKAKGDLRAVEINYRAGNLTKMEIAKAELGVLNAENALRKNMYNHDMLIFSFEHPALLGNDTAGNQKQ